MVLGLPPRASEHTRLPHYLQKDRVHYNRPFGLTLPTAPHVVDFIEFHPVGPPPVGVLPQALPFAECKPVPCYRSAHPPCVARALHTRLPYVVLIGIKPRVFARFAPKPPSIRRKDIDPGLFIPVQAVPVVRIITNLKFIFNRIRKFLI